jgi:hypothetical protein
MSKVIELFGLSTKSEKKLDWQQIVSQQLCPYLDRTCIKVRKSSPEISIGTCAVFYGKQDNPTIICPYRLLERRQIFVDCLHLLLLHEPGNELHVASEVTIPGGSVDYFLVSAKNEKVKDFVGIELQALDTTGTLWPERQRFLHEQGVKVVVADIDSPKKFGMNWKMTAKTILVQLHHKIQTFENINKHLVLVIQDGFLSYMRKEFQFEHVNEVRIGDPMHIHSYNLAQIDDGTFRLNLDSRLSTNTEGVARLLGLQADTNVGLEKIIEQLEAKISPDTLFTV